MLLNLTFVKKMAIIPRKQLKRTNFVIYIMTARIVTVSVKIVIVVKVTKVKIYVKVTFGL